VKRVLITGGSGFIGRKLAHDLLARGDRVTVLTRNVERARGHLPGAVRVAAWAPEKEGPWFEELEVVDAVVHLAGESVATRWTEAKKRAIEQSRVESTRLLVEAIGRAKHKPGVLVCASATGFYGPRPADVQLDESAEPGQGFLAGVVQRWEEAARAVEQHGVRSVEVRIGVVLGEGGGALEKMVTPFKLFVGGPLGDGSQVVPWVHRDDVVGILLLAIDNPEVKGAINAVSPHPATGKQLADALGVVLNRPSWLKTPESVLKVAMGEAAEILTTGQRVFPKRAAELGYEFRHARLLPALESILAR
jgi:uncharacterized protein